MFSQEEGSKASPNSTDPKYANGRGLLKATLHGVGFFVAEAGGSGLLGTISKGCHRLYTSPPDILTAASALRASTGLRCRQVLARARILAALEV